MQKINPIRLLLWKNGHSISDMSKKTGLSAETIRSLINKKIKPHALTIKKISSSYRVNYLTLMKYYYYETRKRRKKK